MSDKEHIEKNLNKFKEIVEKYGNLGTLLSEKDAEKRLQDTFIFHEKMLPLPLVLQLTTKEEIRSALKHISDLKLRIHPISSGRNWGYGTSTPSDKETNIIFDLSKMNKISNIDPLLGIVEIEPGVTQGQLESFLIENQLNFMVPTTGAGPSCSIVGNALERGYGMTPIVDHFQSVLGIKALFPNGTDYISPLWKEKPFDDKNTPIYRWGLGPYIDGLFSQSGGAIVTSLALQLMPRPSCIEMFSFWIKKETDLEDIVNSIKELLGKSGVHISAINLMNKERVSAIADSSLTKDVEWIGTGVMYGEAVAIRAGRKIIKRKLHKLAKKIVFINEKHLGILKKLTKLPFLGKKLKGIFYSLSSAYQILSGYPNEFALSLVYKNNFQSMPPFNKNPAQDDCGLLWYSPLVPIKGNSVKQYIQMVQNICHQYKFSTPITFSTLSISCFDSTIPLIFPKTEHDSVRAFECLKKLIIEGRKLGFYPYRFHSKLMNEATREAPEYWHLAEKIRLLFDPENLISPKRYQYNTTIHIDKKKEPKI